MRPFPKEFDMTWKSIRKKSKNDSHMPATSIRKKWKTGGDISLVKVADIVVPAKLEKPNPDDVAKLAESVRNVGIIHPVPVRRKVTAFGKRSEIELVTGLTRFESYKLLGEQTIPCTYVEDDDDLVRQIQIAENLFRRDDTVLKKSELLAEWVERTEQNDDISGQVDRKPKGGRPESGNAKAARELPSLAKSDEGRRKQIERAIVIAKLATAVKNAAKKAGLDDNQSALLAIAAEKTTQARLAKIHGLSVHKSKGARKDHSTAKKRQKAGLLSTADKKILKGLMKRWNNAEELKQALVQAPQEVMKQFIVNISRDWSLGHAREKRRSNWGD
jgi:ParB-like chromosome segregation protein Spo0J